MTIIFPGNEAAGDVLIPLGQLLAMLGIMLSFSFFIERLLVILTSVIDKLELARGVQHYQVPEKIQENLQLYEKASWESQYLVNPASGERYYFESDEIPYHPEAKIEKSSYFTIQAATPINKTTVEKEFWCQIFGFLIGMIGCYYWKISLLRLLLVESMAGNVKPHWWECILLGIIIGAGSKPVHFLMNFLLTRRISSKQLEADEAEAAEKSAPPLPILPDATITGACLSTLESLVGFDYDGGDRPQRLECTHLRHKPIDLIVYHHSAMHSDASFQDLIDVFENRGWLTGYHCVVFKDGSIRVLCRWDRIGNHVKGFNDGSLGIAFQGNFEVDPKIPCSNVAGKYGLIKPTQAQLDAAARIVSLWCFLYNIPTDFSSNIVPHSQKANKSCPGSNFPSDIFKDRIQDYHDLWYKDAQFKKALALFKAKPMVMA